jgi:hypothetical protein
MQDSSTISDDEIDNSEILKDEFNKLRNLLLKRGVKVSDDEIDIINKTTAALNALTNRLVNLTEESSSEIIPESSPSMTTKLSRR